MEINSTRISMIYGNEVSRLISNTSTAITVITNSISALETLEEVVYKNNPLVSMTIQNQKSSVNAFLDKIESLPPEITSEQRVKEFERFVEHFHMLTQEYAEHGFFYQFFGSDSYTEPFIVPENLSRDKEKCFAILDNEKSVISDDPNLLSIRAEICDGIIATIINLELKFSSLLLDRLQYMDDIKAFRKFLKVFVNGYDMDISNYPYYWIDLGESYKDLCSCISAVLQSYANRIREKEKEAENHEESLENADNEMEKHEEIPVNDIPVSEYEVVLDTGNGPVDEIEK